MQKSQNRNRGANHCARASGPPTPSPPIPGAGLLGSALLFSASGKESRRFPLGKLGEQAGEFAVQHLGQSTQGKKEKKRKQAKESQKGKREKMAPIATSREEFGKQVTQLITETFSRILWNGLSVCMHVLPP